MSITIPEVLAVAGGFAGVIGSIITAFSVNCVLGELHLAQQMLSVTAEAIALGRDVPIFTGTDKRFATAQTHSTRLLWIGVGLLALGFVLQSASALWTSPGASKAWV